MLQSEKIVQYILEEAGKYRRFCHKKKLKCVNCNFLHYKHPHQLSIYTIFHTYLTSKLSTGVTYLWSRKLIENFRYACVIIIIFFKLWAAYSLNVNGASETSLTVLQLVRFVRRLARISDVMKFYFLVINRLKLRFIVAHMVSSEFGNY